MSVPYFLHLLFKPLAPTFLTHSRITATVQRTDIQIKSLHTSKKRYSIVIFLNGIEMDFDFWSTTANKLIIPAISMIMVPWLNSRYKSSNITFRKDKRIIRLDFINSYLAFDIEKRHPISTELAFDFFFGRPIPFEEIEYILKLKNPTFFAKLLKDTSDFVKFDSSLGQYVYKKGFETSRKRQLSRLYRFLGYAFFAFLALFLVENSSTMLTGASPSLITMFIFIVFIFFFSAFTIIKDAPKIIRAEKTIEESKKLRK